MNRRQWVYSASSVAAAGLIGSQEAIAAPQSDSDAGLPAGTRVPAMKFVYDCDATLLPAIPFGDTLEGTRRIIPITGGTVKGPRIRGEVLNIGADWNLSRKDGASSVEAAYYLRTNDGVVIRVVNKGVGTTAAPAAKTGDAEPFFMFTTPVFEAPAGKYDWLNRSIFVATLGARRTAQNAVLIRVFQVV
jgi:Protein of unknown function (DUF3237)